MANTLVRLQSKLMRDYYKYFSKYCKDHNPDIKVAWVTSFAPVEILEALGISYYYPESYAAVIAASDKEQSLLNFIDAHDLSRDCCSYSCCFNGCLDCGDGPRGIPPKPDVLIATNNQCNTLPNWWNVLAKKYNVPLIIIDYPGEVSDLETACSYVTSQHKYLISELENLVGYKLSEERLAELIENSQKSIFAWNKIIKQLSVKDITPTALFDDINFLITARCKPETSEIYMMMEDEINDKPEADNSKIPLFWLGYPLWYHPKRYLSEILYDFRVVGTNYVTWWSLDYSGKDVYEKLFAAYNFTFLNLTQSSRDKKLSTLIEQSGAKCALVLHNKSCKCDFVSARNINIPQAELEMDMIDRSFLDIEKAKNQVTLLKDMVCTV